MIKPASVEKAETLIMQKENSDTQKELTRLAHNNRALVDLLPDMIFIVREDFLIQYMNRAALERFGNCNDSKCHSVILGSDTPCDKNLCPFECREYDKKYGQVFERKLSDDLYVEYTHIPFEGYLQENLSLLIVRDITQKKKHELELERYRKNIEQVLREKIALLRESEKERQQLFQELNHLKKETEQLSGHDKIIGRSKPMRALMEMVYQVAPSDATVLITGESGTGKELVADRIYENSSRVGKPYLKFNCAAVTETLLESDLFGYEKGAFTGAWASKDGKFQAAADGTLFLDEIGEMAPWMQAKLLQVLQDGEFSPLGANGTVSVDVRVLSATNVEIKRLLKASLFRTDLFYRLAVISLFVPPLKERPDDIVPLAVYFLELFAIRYHKKTFTLSPRFWDLLLAYDWPGNVRELENTIHSIVALESEDMLRENLEEQIDPILHLNKQSQSEEKKIKKDVDIFSKEEGKLKQITARAVASAERKLIHEAMKATQGNKKDAAKLLQMSYKSLLQKLKTYSMV